MMDDALNLCQHLGSMVRLGLKVIFFGKLGFEAIQMLCLMDYLYLIFGM